jgi:hypothetical protein
MGCASEVVKQFGENRADLGVPDEKTRQAMTARRPMKEGLAPARPVKGPGRAAGKEGTSMAREQGKPLIEKLVRRLRSSDVAVRVHAAVVLSERGPAAAEAVPGLLQALSDADAHVRRLAAWVLGYTGAAEPEAAAALQGALRDEDDGVRRLAGASLALLSLAGEQRQAS